MGRGPSDHDTDNNNCNSKPVSLKIQSTFHIACDILHILKAQSTVVYMKKISVA